MAFGITQLLRPIFMQRLHRSDEATLDVEEAQRTQLKELIRLARNTQWGREHEYAKISSAEDYAQAVAVTPYDEIRQLVMRMIGGEKNVLWPGVTLRYAQSSGTSDGKSKYIPITDYSLKANHFRGGHDTVARYLKAYEDSRLFSGKSFILGGSYANELHLPTGSKVRVGDLSANLIDNVSPLVEMVRVPSKKVALMANWHEKLPALVRAAAKANVTNISGVPSWFLTVLTEMLAYTGASKVHEVWPNLEVFFHGGISFVPYRQPYADIIDSERMRYVETYNASEGFFAVQDSVDSRAMRLLLDAGVYYEFIPVGNPSAPPLRAWEVEQGKIYAMVISASNGLWRYPIGDTVRIESTSPLRITIAGRTKHYINAFGEEVMVHNTDAALAKACKEHGCSVANYTVAPVFSTSRSHGHHQWLIEFTQRPVSIEAFALSLDRALMSENSDYQAKRSDSIFLDQLEIVEAKPGVFDRWLESTGKLGGQRKIPRLSNDRNIFDKLLNLQTNPI